MTTQTTGEALALLEDYRAGQIADARDVACELIEHFGQTSVRQVQEVMVQRDLIDESLGNFWIGAIFNHPQFEWNGQWEFPNYALKIATKNKAHAYRPIKIWVFSKPTNGGFFTSDRPARGRSDVRTSTTVKPMRIRKRRK